ncbi:hypothetical protein [Mycolicibacterium fortuitum]|uniref:hypothetical protein n=1 Tax=Mycolicibacterium fortuitum TaxID=1766 RepID=UPI002630CC24|nr:hypothetical protein [Mycolicibacterium fortuitum]
MKVSDVTDSPHICCICREVLPDWPRGANNPDPVTADGHCCNSCNDSIVTPAREAVQP